MKISALVTRTIDYFYLPPLRHLLPLQTFRYAACGGITVGLDLFWYAVLYNFVLDKEIVHVGPVAISPYIAALLIVTPITFFTGFWLNRHVAFRQSPLRGRVQLFRYLLSVCGSVLINYIVLKLLVGGFAFYPTPSKAVATVVTTIYSYLMQKYFSFRGCAQE